MNRCFTPYARTAQSGRPPVRRGVAEGFTLIELLIVIAVIVLLAALLLPALTRVKEKAHRTQCLSQQRQWAMAFRMYVDDHDNMIPREAYERFGEVKVNNWTQVIGRGDSEDVWYNALPEYVGAPRAAFYALTQKKREAFYSSKSFFHCPAARFRSNPPPWTSRTILFSMAMNSQLIEFPRVPTIRFDTLNGEESRTVLFLDNLLEGEKKVIPEQDDEYLGQPAAHADRFSARHGNGGNLAFADGHVAWFPGNKVVETNPESPLRGGPIMPPVDIVWEPKYDF